jgi:OFA family oxalate/formate antiporter-like MFS transporter
VTLVGVLSVCNGLGRILTGALFDAKGRRFTMLAANVLTIAAAGVTLAAVFMSSLPLCIAGLCLVGMSYGSCPTVSSAFVSAFYGTKYFPTNFSIMNFNLIGSSLMATACGSLLTSSGGYMAPFALLLGLSVGALVLNLLIRKP